MEKHLLSLDPVFALDEDWHNNACLNYLHDSFGLYVIGYKEAADSLIAKVDGYPRCQDSLVFPICFLYRQYIELRLKAVISSGRLLLDEPEVFPHHHNIQNLWSLSLGILKKVFAENIVDIVSKDELALAAHVVEQFSKIDQDSFAFRYPTDKQGNNTLEGIGHINLRRVAKYVNAFAEIMDAGSTAISVYLDQKSEMDSYYSDYV